MVVSYPLRAHRALSQGLYAMTNSNEHFVALNTALFGGRAKAADLKIMPGSASFGRERRAQVLLESMIRLGIVKDGLLVDLDRD